MLKACVSYRRPPLNIRQTNWRKRRSSITRLNSRWLRARQETAVQAASQTLDRVSAAPRPDMRGLFRLVASTMTLLLIGTVAAVVLTASAAADRAEDVRSTT